MIFISLEQVLQMHVLVVRTTGGSEGLRDLGRLESAIASQKQEVFGEELYRSVFDKAAALCRGIIADHPFVDGNKRTAMLTAMTFLELNGYQLVVCEGEVEEFAVNVAVDHLDIKTISAWLAGGVRKF